MTAAPEFLCRPVADRLVPPALLAIAAEALTVAGELIGFDTSGITLSWFWPERNPEVIAALAPQVSDEDGAAAFAAAGDGRALGMFHRKQPDVLRLDATLAPRRLACTLAHELVHAQQAREHPGLEWTPTVASLCEAQARLAERLLQQTDFYKKLEETT